jgi:hypothetical protein
VTAVEIAGTHDLAGANPDALVACLRDFLAANGL